MMNEKVRTRWARFHRAESGALAIFCLAGILIILMMGLLIFDVTEIANEKVHIQATADASAHTQATVMARQMNMNAFANVGKRINIGYVTAYDAVMGWLGWLVAAGWVLAAGCYLLIPVVPPIAGLCPQITQIVAGATCVYGLEEANDRRIGNRWNNVVRDTYGPEIRAFNNYQQYMADITPYWAWSAGVWRGFVNSAPVTVGYPAPKDGLTYQSRLPVRPRENHSWDTMCEKINRAPSARDVVGETFSGGASAFLSEVTQQADRWYMFGDFLLKNLISSMSSGGQGAFESGPPGDVGVDPVETEDGDGGISGCAELEDLVNNNQNATLDPRVECPPPPPPDSDEEPEECDRDERYLHVDGESIKVGDACNLNNNQITEALGDAFRDAMGAIDCGTVSQIGKYGGPFLAGVMALLFDPTEAFSGGGLIARLLRRAFPESFRRRCDGTGRGTTSPDRFAHYRAEGAAWELDTRDWSMYASTLMFAYRPNASRNREARDKYVVGGDPSYSILNTSSSGVWGLSRGEITWQATNSSSPNKWESEWGARIRPVALEGEWEGYGGDFSLWKALQEIEAEMFAAVLLAHGFNFVTPEAASELITHPYNLGSAFSWDTINEYVSTSRSFNPMTNERMQGLSK